MQTFVHNQEGNQFTGFFAIKKCVSVDEKKEKERKKETQTNAALAKLRSAAHFARLAAD